MIKSITYDTYCTSNPHTYCIDLGCTYNMPYTGFKMRLRYMSTNKEDCMTYTVVIISLLLNYGLGYLITNDWIWSMLFVLLTLWIFIPLMGVILSPLIVLIVSSKGVATYRDKTERELKIKETTYPLTQGVLPPLSKRLKQDNYEQNKKGTV